MAIYVSFNLSILLLWKLYIFLVLWKIKIIQMLVTAPSWSIPGKYEASKNLLTPAPSAYYPDKWNQTHTPSWKIGRSVRDKENKNSSPGPGQYLSKTDKNINKFGKFNKQNRIKQIVNENPSPVSYSPLYAFSRPSSPSVSISGKKTEHKNQRMPGPGDYDNKYDCKKSHVTVKIGKQERFSVQKVEGPGPQAYTPLKNQFKQVSIGFTRTSKNSTSYYDTEQLKVPGPGEYSTIDLFSSGKKQNKGFSMPGKPKFIEKDRVPGPGEYNPIDSTLNLSPKISIKGKYKDHTDFSTPSPADYFIHNLKSDSSAFSIGRQPRNTVNYFRYNPGPGQYDPKSVSTNTPVYSLRGSAVREQRVIAPGPGSYNPDKNIVKRRPQSAKIGTAKRGLIQKAQIPGPGSYEHKSRPSTPCSSFTRQERNRKNLYLTPGPGDYNIKALLGDSPSYAKKC